MARSGAEVAADRAVRTDRRRLLQVPHPRAIAEQLVGEDAGRAQLDQVARERTLERALLEAPEVDAIAAAGRPEVAAARHLLIEAAAAIARDAAVHLVRDELPQVLIGEGTLAAPKAPMSLARGDGQILELAFAAFVADRTIVRMVLHQPLEDEASEFDRAGIERGDFLAVRGRGHARHHQPRLSFDGRGDGADATGADGAEIAVVAEHRNLDAGLEARLHQIGSGRNGHLAAVEEQVRHGRPPPRARARTDNRRASRAPRGSGGSVDRDPSPARPLPPRARRTSSARWSRRGAR